MNIAIIFAGGSGIRMHTKDKPKQFLLIHGKPIIVHTIEQFENHEEIDAIIVVCIENWITYMEEMKYRYRLEKIVSIIPGGETGQLSIYNGLREAVKQFGVNDNIVLIHDGVRPLIDKKIISNNIASVKKNGSAITCSMVKETIVIVTDEENIKEIPNRNNSRIAKAPQSFWLKDIYEAHNKALAEGLTNIIDSCTMMNYFSKEMAVVICTDDNIKITTPEDFYIFRALYDVRENQQFD